MSWANCQACGQQMATGGGCVDPGHNRIAWGAERAGTDASMEAMHGDDWREEPWNCHDCNAGPGKFHHPGCDSEECPHCGGQAGFCGAYFSEGGWTVAHTREYGEDVFGKRFKSRQAAAAELEKRPDLSLPGTIFEQDRS